MAKLSKKQKEARLKVDSNKIYTLKEASSLVKDITSVNFDPSIDMAIRLGVDPKKANQMVRGVVALPHGTGKNVRVLALVTPDKENDAKEAGADHVGLDDYLQKIKDGWTDIDVIVTMPSVMGKLGPLGRVLGPRGLMQILRQELLLWISRKPYQMLRVEKLILKLTKMESFTPPLESHHLQRKKFLKMQMSYLKQLSN